MPIARAGSGQNQPQTDRGGRQFFPKCTTPNRGYTVREKLSTPLTRLGLGRGAGGRGVLAWAREKEALQSILKVKAGADRSNARMGITGSSRMAGVF